LSLHLEELGQLDAAASLYMCSSVESMLRYFEQEPVVTLKKKSLESDSESAAVLCSECLKAIDAPIDRRFRHPKEAQLILATYLLSRTFPGFADEIAKAVASRKDRALRLVLEAAMKWSDKSVLLLLQSAHYWSGLFVGLSTFSEPGLTGKRHADVLQKSDLLSDLVN
jgi:hypothetical protein